MIDDMDVPTSMTTCQDQISLLHELALMLENASGVEEILNRALALMATRLGMMRGAITLVDPSDKKIRIRAAYGLKAAEMRRGEYLPGEGVTGKVIESGKGKQSGLFPRTSFLPMHPIWKMNCVSCRLLPPCLPRQRLTARQDCRSPAHTIRASTALLAIANACARYMPR